MTIDIVVRDDDHEPTLLFNPAAWVKDAACRGLAVNLFVTERGELIDEAKRVCATCTVKDECLRYALDNGIRYGVWGGTSERDRRALRRDPDHQRPPTTTRMEPTTTYLCGTRSGYHRHYRKGETPCLDCRRAAAAYVKQIRAAKRATACDADSSPTGEPSTQPHTPHTTAHRDAGGGVQPHTSRTVGSVAEASGDDDRTEVVVPNGDAATVAVVHHDGHRLAVEVNGSDATDDPRLGLLHTPDGGEDVADLQFLCGLGGHVDHSTTNDGGCQPQTFEGAA